MKKQLKKDGITLISLVITIIVLLILASVAIALAVDADGLFPRAEYAKDQWNNRVSEEESAINNALLILNEIDPQGGTGTGGEEGGDGDDDEVVLPEGWNKETVTNVVEEGDRKAPIPKGYTASKIPGEDKISDGLVIYEGTDSVTGTKGSAQHENAMTTRNQYVWIPVDNINSMVMCQKCGASKELDETTLQCPECGETTKLAGKLYDGEYDTSTYGHDFDENKSDQTYTQNSGLREPDTVPDYDGDNSFELESFQNAFNEMAKSVAKYKGFYISRYEIQAGAASKKGATVLNAGSSGARNWYGLYTTIQNSTTPSSTTSQMIWGCQYDQIMMYVDGKPDGSEAHAAFDVQEASSTRKRSSGEVSGNNSADLVCNIYDLENNYCEWTAEAGGTFGRVNRGGDYSRSFFASYRHILSPAEPYDSFSSRAALYIAN